MAGGRRDDRSLQLPGVMTELERLRGVALGLDGAAITVKSLLDSADAYCYPTGPMQ